MSSPKKPNITLLALLTVIVVCAVVFGSRFFVYWQQRGHLSVAKAQLQVDMEALFAERVQLEDAMQRLAAAGYEPYRRDQVDPDVTVGRVIVSFDNSGPGKRFPRFITGVLFFTPEGEAMDYEVFEGKPQFE